MTLFILKLCIATLTVVVNSRSINEEPCLHKHPLLDKLARRVFETAPGFSVDNDCRMYASHPSVLGGGHEAVYVDHNGHIEETGSNTPGLDKDLIEDHAVHTTHEESHQGTQPLDGLPIKFRTEEREYTNDVYSHDEGREGE